MVDIECEDLHEQTFSGVRARQIERIGPRSPQNLVRGLSSDTTNETPALAFEPFGPIEECKAVTDKAGSRLR
ncbi:hypothetical protein NL676_035708 [Syzygium grande]|nr:hypothetical protein NL676_035708 [Syzygium grande]